jgi:hypothetical protein
VLTDGDQVEAMDLLQKSGEFLMKHEELHDAATMVY